MRFRGFLALEIKLQGMVLLGLRGVGGPGYRANVQGLGLRDDDLQLVNAAESRF